MAVFPPVNVWQYPASSWIFRYKLYEDPALDDHQRLIIQFKSGFCCEYSGNDLMAQMQYLAMFFAPSKGRFVNDYFKRQHWPYAPIRPPDP